MDNMLDINFIGIGSGKCGSTWFFENLVQHPEFFDGNPKEINYFSDLYDQYDIDWYRQQFKGAVPGQLKGEFSVTYMYHPLAATRIKEVCPNTKIIAIVRDPITRTFSDFLHAKRKGDISEHLPFSSYIDNRHNLEFGNYSNYLKPFLDIFPPNQIKIIVLEDFNKDLTRAFKDIYTFLGAKDTDFIPEGVEKRRNQARNYRFLKLENLLVKTYRFLAKAGYTRLTEVIKRSGIPELFRKLNEKSGPVPTIDRESKDKLSVYYEQERKLISALTSSSLDGWQ